jgi:ABC-type nickel/cobalt efflux system permease component RcnA
MNPKSYFEKTLAANEVELKRIRKLSLLLSMLRLAVFLAVALIVYFFLDNTVVIATSIGLGVAVFLFLVSKYTDAKNKKLII